MKLVLSRGAAVITALALAGSLAPGALAQSVPEPEAAFFALAEEPVLELVGGYCEGRCRVTDGTLWGFAGADGSVVIQPQFDSVTEFSLGVAKVTRNGKEGLLRWDGTMLLQCRYDALTAVNYGVYLARSGSQWDVIGVTNAPVGTDGAVCILYTGLAGASVETQGTSQRLVLREQDGTVTRIDVATLPQVLKSSRADGWQFPLNMSRKADFQDVAENDWFVRWVNLAYSVGLMEGTGGGAFQPTRALTVAETLRIAACLESRARQDDFHLQSVSGAYWYRSSVTYCEACGVIAAGRFSQTDLTRPVTRAEMAEIFSATTSVRSMELISSLNVVKRSVPDVAPGDCASDAIFGLYAKGILNGTDADHSFCPEDSLSRAEAAAIVARIARPEQRIEFW